VVAFERPRKQDVAMAGSAGGLVDAPLEQELLERADALTVFEEAFAASRRGRGRPVFVSGEAGIGKSTQPPCKADARIGSRDRSLRVKSLATP
jgi:hypothetical protein